jgi:hypothetical protein
MKWQEDEIIKQMNQKRLENQEVVDEDEYEEVELKMKM